MTILSGTCPGYKPEYRELQWVGTGWVLGRHGVDSSSNPVMPFAILTIIISLNKNVLF